MLESKVVSHIGCVRECNEDAVFFDIERSLWLLADGVGGHGNGQLASSIAVQTIERKLRQGLSLQAAVRGADEAILQAIADDEALQGMATTIVACRLEACRDDYRFELSWVGDSRAYVMDELSITQLSHDHVHSNDKALSQALGCLDLAELPLLRGTLKAGQTLLLCSDGLTTVLSDQDMLALVQEVSAIEDFSARLLAETLAKGAPDNVSFALVRPGSAAGAIACREARKPFDIRAYERNAKQRPYLLAIILLSVLALLVLI